MGSSNLRAVDADFVDRRHGISLQHLELCMGVAGVAIVPVEAARDPDTPLGRQARESLDAIAKAFAGFLGPVDYVGIGYQVGEYHGVTDRISLNSHFRKIPTIPSSAER